MARTFILGNKHESWMYGIDLPISIPQDLNTNANDAITDFIANNFSSAEDEDKIVFSLDSVVPELALTIALHIRLHYVYNTIIARLPILFVSRLPEATYLHCGIGSQLFLSSKGIYYCAPNQIKYDLSEVCSLTPSEYKDCFLRHIHINPDAKVGNHSIANEWGVGIMAECLGFAIDKFPHKNSLYFKYSRTSNKISSIKTQDHETIEPVDTTQKRILLIDDESNNGLSLVVKKLLNNDKIDIFSQKVSSYQELSDELKVKFIKGYYDLILLDLRLFGSEETPKNNLEYSGLKVLKGIKKANPGTQVIMITASNKAWNLKRLLDAGADGYYVKEAPDYNFTTENSLDNLEALCNEIEKCLRRYYLRGIYKRIQSLKSKMEEENALLNPIEMKELCVQLDSFYVLISQADQREPCEKENDPVFAYSYIALEQIFEIIARCLINESTTNRKDSAVYTFRYNGNKCTKWYISGKKAYKNTRNETNNYAMWEKVSAIYYTLLGGEDAQLGYMFQQLIEKRNNFIHADTKLKSVSAEISTPKSNTELFDVVEELLDQIINFEGE